ncbi:SRPBCC family protein [Vogesella sp. GCM10023246]|uniref:SRPBCC family protein n=1 Tax=Vogesella oryzagri TaxID=3160864 RepID=A0ABV1M5Z0_9NEIS
MSTQAHSDPRELQLSRLLPATPEQVYRAWTEPALLCQWFAPLPYTTPHAELDVRPGGSNLVVMRDPDGNDYPNAGVYLEVIPNQKLVITDAYSRAWQPAEKPFMTVILTFAAEAGGTRYTALVRHWSVADREAHEAMGFHSGWGQATDQLAALLARL